MPRPPDVSNLVVLLKKKISDFIHSLLKNIWLSCRFSTEILKIRQFNDFREDKTSGQTSWSCTARGAELTQTPTLLSPITAEQAVPRGAGRCRPGDGRGPLDLVRKTI